MKINYDDAVDYLQANDADESRRFLKENLDDPEYSFNLLSAYMQIGNEIDDMIDELDELGIQYVVLDTLHITAVTVAGNSYAIPYIDIVFSGYRVLALDDAIMLDGVSMTKLMTDITNDINKLNEFVERGR
jgi:hypothetical protein